MIASPETSASGRANALRDAVRAFLLSRLTVFAVAAIAALAFAPRSLDNEVRYDKPDLTHPFRGGGLARAADMAFSPLARWDATWYLTVARDGYGDADAIPEGQGPLGFLPGYPWLVRVVGGFSSSPGVLLIASYLVSLAAFLAAAYLINRLVTLETGDPEMGRLAALLMAFFPASFFLGAPYSEGLFLALSLGSFYAARNGRWAMAGALGAAASVTRLAGLALLVPLAILYLYGPRTDRPPERSEGRRPRYRLRADIAWLALVPGGIAAWCAYLGLRFGDPFLYFSLQRKYWYHEFAGPLGGIFDGASAAFDGVEDLLAASPADGVTAQFNIVCLGFLVFAIVATVGAFRRLPLAYGAYSLAALAIPLSSPQEGLPLISLYRSMAVVFPLFAWLAIASARRGAEHGAVAVSATLLGLFTAQFATWQFFY